MDLKKKKHLHYISKNGELEDYEHLEREMMEEFSFNSIVYDSLFKSFYIIISGEVSGVIRDENTREWMFCLQSIDLRGDVYKYEWFLGQGGYGINDFFDSNLKERFTVVSKNKDFYSAMIKLKDIQLQGKDILEEV